MGYNAYCDHCCTKTLGKNKIDDTSNFKLNIQNNFWLYLVDCVIILWNTILSHVDVYYCVCPVQIRP